MVPDRRPLVPGRIGAVDIAVIGLGLIGGSALRALARQGHRMLGYDADPATRATARTAAAKAPPQERWQVAGALREAVAGAEIVVLAVPLPAVPAVLDGLADAGHPGLITDVTSVKAPIHDLVAAPAHPGPQAGGPGQARADGPGASGQGRTRPGRADIGGPGRTRPDGPAAGGRRLGRFVGGHPMAGRETSGFAASDPDLFTGCAWVLCLEPGLTALPDWLLLADLVTRLGARAVPTTAAEHDRAVAEISHVPHLLAAAIAAGTAGHPLAGTLAAGSFRDGTRVAASPPDLIAAMCGGNAPAVRPALDRVRDALDQARSALDTTDPAASIAALRTWLEPGCTARAGWPPRPGEPRELPADAGTLLRLGRAGGWVTAVSPDHTAVTAVLPV